MKKVIGIGLVAIVALTGLFAFSLPFNAAQKQGTNCRLVAGEVIQQGWLVSVWTNGLAYGAGDYADHTVVGVAMGSAAIGATVDARGGIFRYENKGVFGDKDIGSYAYMWTNSTHYSVGTAAVATEDVKAGTIVDVDADGVWIDTRRQ